MAYRKASGSPQELARGDTGWKRRSGTGQGGYAAETLVTGSTGLVGSALVERLVPRGYEIRALARKTSGLSHPETMGAKIVFGGITVYDTLPPAVKGIDLVFHCAAKVTPDCGNRNEYEKTTVRGTENVLTASTEAGVKRFLQVSSHAVYGEPCVKETSRPTRGQGYTWSGSGSRRGNSHPAAV